MKPENAEGVTVGCSGLVGRLRGMVLDMTTQREPQIERWPRVCAEAANEIERLRGLLAEAERLCMEYCPEMASDALVDDWANNQVPNAALNPPAAPGMED